MQKQRWPTSTAPTQATEATPAPGAGEQCRAAAAAGAHRAAPAAAPASTVVGAWPQWQPQPQRRPPAWRCRRRRPVQALPRLAPPLPVHRRACGRRQLQRVEQALAQRHGPTGMGMQATVGRATAVSCAAPMRWYARGRRARCARCAWTHRRWRRYQSCRARCSRCHCGGCCFASGGASSDCHVGGRHRCCRAAGGAAGYDWGLHDGWSGRALCGCGCARGQRRGRAWLP